MTHACTQAPQKRTERHTGGIFLLLGTLFCLLLILKNPEVAVRSVGKGISLTVGSVIPSLFPFMVISRLVVSGDLISYLPKRLFLPLRRLLGLSDGGCAAVLLGLLCGAPIGACCAVLSFGRGEMQKKEAERVLSCSSCPSSAFVVGALGVTMLGDRTLGVRIYLAALFSCLLSGLLLRFWGGSVATSRDFAVPHRRTRLSASLFTDAMASSAKSMLLISAYVVFFSALMGALSATLERFCPSSELSTVLFCLLELSGGAQSAAGLDNRTLALLLSAFAVGWSGLSVHCQVSALCDGTGISLSPYLFAKLLQGFLCPLLTWAFTLL